jgi:hypothetical protein
VAHFQNTRFQYTFILNQPTLNGEHTVIPFFQLVTLETTLRLYWRDPRLKVEHLLGNKSNDNSYILLHPEAGKYIWFPDIYIGERLT